MIPGKFLTLVFATLTAMLFAAGGHAQPSFDEYDLIGYTTEASHNPIAELAGRLERGEAVLEFRGHRGYFDSLLKALDIDSSSQALVFSGTSLQKEHISPATPRAIYFNDDAYVAWVQGSDLVEMASVDDELGLVFYLFNNRRDGERLIERTNQRCLVCHDSAGTMGGGVPELMVLSSVYSEDGFPLANSAGGQNTRDRTPLIERWGGWYVTGRHGDQGHLGNVMLPGKAALDGIEAFRHGNLDTLAGQGFFDTGAYLRDTSDIVALMALEHQLTVLNLITYVKFKAPAVLRRAAEEASAGAPSWEVMTTRAQHALSRMLDRLLHALLFVDAADYTAPISGNPDYRAWFEAQGPHDAKGRSLRTLNLRTRLLEYPLSYLIYTEAFDTLPAYAKDYLYRRLTEILEGRDHDEAFAHLTASQQRDIREILRDTKPEFRAYLGGE